MSSRYHHGTLPDALRSATAQLVAERGPSGFSLREVARRAGVSHAAPKHHFGSSKGLLTSVAIEGFTQLGDEFERVAAENTGAIERLRLLGRAYVNTALAYPGHFGVMFQRELVESDDYEFLECTARTYGLLVETIEQIRDEINPELDIDTAALIAWAAMHGLVELAPKLDVMADREQRPLESLDDTIDRFSDLLVNGFKAR